MAVHALKNVDNLIWLDMEMTGLSSVDNVIIEIAVIITDTNLNIIAQSPSYAIKQDVAELDKMDKWNKSTHTKSGLIERVKQSSMTVKNVEHELLALMKKYVYKGMSPLCGNTVHQDRKFLAKYMPLLEDFFHYRNLDVSTIKELAKRWYPNTYKQFVKHNKHEALADIQESINELLYYREHLFIASPV